MVERCTSPPSSPTSVSGGRLAVDTLAEAAQEGANGRFPKMGPGLLAKDAHRALVVVRLTVGPVGNQDIVGVGDRQDACLERNLLAAQSVGIAAAIDALVVRDHDFGLPSKARHPQQDLVSERRVTFDGRPLARIERAWLVEDGIRDADLADVVEKSGASECAPPG